MKHAVIVIALAAAGMLVGCNNDAQATAPRHAGVKTAATARRGVDWSKIVNPSAAGSFVMGNPDAKVKLVEIGSLSCPHCRAFDQEGVPTLIDKYIRTGAVSWEYRPYLIHGPIDLAADLIVRCNGAKGFYPLVRALYHDQSAWMAKLDSAPEDKLAQIQNLAPGQAFVAMGNLLGFQDWAARHGLTRAKADQCLGNQTMIDAEVRMTSETNARYPEFAGTPAFIINDQMLPKEVTTFGLLEPQLRKALK